MRPLWHPVPVHIREGTIWRARADMQDGRLAHPPLYLADRQTLAGACLRPPGF